MRRRGAGGGMGGDTRVRGTRRRNTRTGQCWRDKLGADFFDPGNMWWMKYDWMKDITYCMDETLKLVILIVLRPVLTTHRCVTNCQLLPPLPARRFNHDVTTIQGRGGRWLLAARLRDNLSGQLAISNDECSLFFFDWAKPTDADLESFP